MPFLMWLLGYQGQRMLWPAETTATGAGSGCGRLLSEPSLGFRVLGLGFWVLGVGCWV